MVTKTIYLKTASGTYRSTFDNGSQFASIVEQNQFKLSVGYKYGEEHKVNTLSLTISGTPALVNEFISYTHIKYQKGETVKFAGVLSKITKNLEEKTFVSCSLTYDEYPSELEDITYGGTGVEYTSTDAIKVIDSTPATSLLHILANRLNTACSNFFTITYPTYTNSDVVEFFKREATDSVLDDFVQLLKENGLAYYVEYDQLVIVDSLKDFSSSTAHNVTHTEVGLEIEEKAYVDKTMPTICLPNLEIGESKLVWRGEGDILANDYYPSETETMTATFSYATEDNQSVKKYVYTGKEEEFERAVISLSDTPNGIYYDSWSQSGSSAIFRLKNTSILKRHWQIKMYANVYLFDYSTRYVATNYDINDEEEECEFIFSNTSAQRYVEALAKAKEKEAKTYSFSSSEELGINTVVTLQDVATSLLPTSQMLIITNRTDYGEDDHFDYEAVAYDGTAVSCSKTYIRYTDEHPENPYTLALEVSRNIVDCRNSTSTPIDNTPVKVRVHYTNSPSLPVVKVDGTTQTLLDEYILDEAGTSYVNTEWKYFEIPANLGGVDMVSIVATLGSLERRATVSKWKNTEASNPITVTEFCYGTATEPQGDLVGYTDSNVEYVLSADDIDVGGIAWTKDTLPTPTDGRYIWYRVGTYTPPQTEADITSWSVFRLAGEDKTFKLTANEYTYIRNARESNKLNTIVLTPNVGGHTGTPTITVYYNKKGGEVYTNVTNGVVTIPYTISEDVKQLVCVLSMTDDAGFNLEDICVLTVSDKTGEVLCLGVVTQASEVPTTTDSGSLINGDYFVVGAEGFIKDGVRYYAGTTYVYNNTVWDIMNSKDSTNAGKFLSCLDALKKADVDLSDISDNNTVSWFNDIITDNLYANKIVSRVISSDGYTEDETSGSPIYGYKLDYQGGEENKGQIKCVGGLFIGMDIRGDLNLSKGNDVAGANIIHPALQTVSGTAGDDTGVTVANNPVGWQADDLPINTSEPYSVTGTYGDNTVTRAVKVTSTSATMYSALNNTITWGSNHGQHRAYHTKIYSFDYDAVVSVKVTRPYCCNSSPILQHYYCAKILIEEINDSGVTTRLIDSVERFDRSWFKRAECQNVTWSSTFNVSKNSRIRIATDCDLGTGWIGEYWTGSFTITASSYTFQDNGLNKTGLWLYYNNNWYHHNGIETTRLNLTSPAVDSNNYLLYYNINNFVNYSEYTASGSTKYLSLDVPYGITSSSLYYKGTGVTALFFTRTSSTSCTLTLDDGTRITLEKDKYAKLRGTIKVNGSSEGLMVKALYPRTDGIYDIGTGELSFNFGYIDHISGECSAHSSRALKQDITPFTRNALDIINATDIVNFRYKRDVERFHNGIDDEITDYIGFIADDTDKSIAGEKQDKMIVNNCIGVLMKAVQELSAEIETLKGDN